MAKVYTIDPRTRKEKVDDFKAKAKGKFNDVVQWIKENKDVICLVGPIVCTVVGGTTRVISKTIQRHTLDKEIDFKQRTIYDRSLGRYVELKRALTPDQALIIEERRSQGEKLSMILDSMGLLKH